MNIILYTMQVLHINATDLSELIGISYTEMSDIFDGTKQPTQKIYHSCNTAIRLFAQH